MSFIKFHFCKESVKTYFNTTEISKPDANSKLKVSEESLGRDETPRQTSHEPLAIVKGTLQATFNATEIIKSDATDFLLTQDNF